MKTALHGVKSMQGLLATCFRIPALVSLLARDGSDEGKNQAATCFR